jgi:hypothetical protein
MTDRQLGISALLDLIADEERESGVRWVRLERKVRNATRTTNSSRSQTCAAKQLE